MKKITRRTCLKNTALILGANALPALVRPPSARAAEAPPPATAEETAAIAEIGHQFLERFSAPGLSVAIAHHGQLVYKQAFGHADAMKREPLTTSHLFRIASVSKPITSAALFSFIEQGKLGLNDPVFGERGVLKFEYGRGYPDNINEITIHHLLTHTCGGWHNDSTDPMFHNEKLGHKALIEHTLHTQPLDHPPGTHYAYSNFGYCILGRVLEKLSGQSYPEAAQQTVLAKCGITDMRIGGNTLAQRAKGEVIYSEQNGENPYNMNVARMDSHGGWIGAPSDLVQFALRVDGFDDPPDILRPETIKTMTTPTEADPNYACGWAVNKAPNWWHGGSLPGTSTILVRTASGLCWAGFTNTRAKEIDGALDQMMWKMVKAVPAWRA